jgi:2-oxoglutarate dehydrogenase E1 component
MKRSFRKPLVIMTPKSLLRHKLAVSRVGDFTDGRFLPMIEDSEIADRAAVRKLLVCAGKVYYTLFEARREREIEDVGIVRMEQLYPFPEEEFQAVLAGYPHLERVIWVQEEPANMGAWRNTRHRFEQYLPQAVRLDYAGRPAAASPATGSHHVHEMEEKALVDAAFGD